MNIVAIPGTLPFGSYLPFLNNPRFTGRKKELNKLLTGMTVDGASRKSKSKLCALVITGMAGVGKTQLVVEFAYKYGYQFRGVHWINMHHPDGVEAAIALCGKEMGLTYTDSERMAYYTMQAWVTSGPRLLILDNFDEIDSADRILAPFLNPALRLLITSRRRDWSRNIASIQELELSPFTKPQSIVFLKQSLDATKPTEVLDSLATQLGNLPLALTMAANYINVTGVQVAEYQKELKEFKYTFVHESMKSDWFTEMDIASPTHYQEGLMATFQISWRKVKNENHQNAYKISGYCAPNTPIPLEIFREALGKNEKTIKAALYRLNSLTLINLSGELPIIHSQLAEHARYLDQDSFSLSLAAQAIAEIACELNVVIDRTGNYSLYSPILPHVRSIAEYAERARIIQTIRLWNSLGRHLLYLADYNEAESAFWKAIQSIQAIYPNNHYPALSLILNNYGEACLGTGHLQEAQSAFEMAQEKDEMNPIACHSDVARDVYNLGRAWQEIGNYIEAEKHFEKALRIDESCLDSNYGNVARDLNGLGELLLKMDRFDAARSAFKRALDLCQTDSNPCHPRIASYSHNYGVASRELCDFNSAIDALESALRLRRNILPAGHPDIKNTEKILLDMKLSNSH